MNLLKEYGIKEDSRFKQARKEIRRIIYLIVFEFIWVYTFGYIGTRTDPGNYSYVLGFPMWFFWAFAGAGVIFPIIAIILALKTKDCSLTDDIKNSNMETNH